MNQTLNRRTFVKLMTISGLGAGLTPLTVSCTASSRNTPSLKVRLLKNSIPPQLLSQFKRSLKQPYRLDFAADPQLQTLYDRLTPPKTQNSPFDLLTLGDYWLETAIQQKLLQPLNPEQLQHWQNLPPQCQQLVRRNDQGQLDPQGKIWGAPYLWGTTVIVYNRDQFKSLGWTPTDWSDLWRPELTDRISLLNHPREVIGLTLKKLGRSYNLADLETVPQLKTELLALQQQTKFYSSDTYLQPLIEGDIWAAVGWSTDVLRILSRYPKLAAVVPVSGTALWANVWVQPQGSAPENPLANQWIDFCWLKDKVGEFSLLAKATSPVVVQMNRHELPKALQANAVLFPQPAILDKSEFLQPLASATLKQYAALWREMRSR